MVSLFLLQKYPEHKGAVEGSCAEKHEYHSLYFHKMGTPQSEDVLVADFRSHPEYMVSVGLFHVCYIKVQQQNFVKALYKTFMIKN